VAVKPGATYDRPYSALITHDSERVCKQENDVSRRAARRSNVRLPCQTSPLKGLKTLTVLKTTSAYPIACLKMAEYNATRFLTDML
jgi:hypothetical protein